MAQIAQFSSWWLVPPVDERIVTTSSLSCHSAVTTWRNWLCRYIWKSLLFNGKVDTSSAQMSFITSCTGTKWLSFDIATITKFNLLKNLLAIKGFASSYSTVLGLHNHACLYRSLDSSGQTGNTKFSSEEQIFAVSL